MFSFPYSRQILIPLLLSILSTICLAFAVFDCNLVHVTNGWQDIRGVSIGLWKTADAINGNHLDAGARGTECVPWTAEQVDAFDGIWMYGRYSGVVAFCGGILVTVLLVSTICFKLPAGVEIALVCLQLVLAVLSPLLMIVLRSNICTEEFDCWPGVGGVLCVGSSLLFLIGCFSTFSVIGYANDEQHQQQADDEKSECSTERLEYLDELDVMP